MLVVLWVPRTWCCSAYITPILKKANLDSSDPKSYRPISNLSVSVPSKHLVVYVLENDLFPAYQTITIRLSDWTETAGLKVLSDILLALASWHYCHF